MRHATKMRLNNKHHKSQITNTTNKHNTYFESGAPARGGQGGQAPTLEKIGWARPTLEICLTDHFDGPF